MLGNQTFHVFCSFEKYLLSNFPSCISSLVSASCSTVGHQILFHPFSPLLPGDQGDDDHGHDDIVEDDDLKLLWRSGR